jgi:hypothetical protein
VHQPLCKVKGSANYPSKVPVASCWVASLLACQSWPSVLAYKTARWGFCRRNIRPTPPIAQQPGVERELSSLPLALSVRDQTLAWTSVRYPILLEMEATRTEPGNRFLARELLYFCIRSLINPSNDGHQSQSQSQSEPCQAFALTESIVPRC